MRDFKGMKRQRGRNNRGSSGGKPQQHNANRAFDSNGPEGVKVRGAAQSVYEKYQQLARDATSSGDRVLAENYLQHAEHYFRVLRAIQPNRPVSDIVGKDVYSAYEIDFEAEPPEEPEVVETPAQPEGQGEGGENGEGGEQRRDRFENRDRNRDRDRNFDNNRNDRPRDNNQGEGRRDRWRDRDDRPRDDRPRDDRPRDDRPRDDRPRDDRPRDDRPRDDRPQREDRFRDDRPRDDRPREDRPVAAVAEGEVQPQAEGEAREGRRRGRDRDRNRDRDWQPRGDRDPLAVIEPEASPLPTSSAPASESSPVLRGQDGAVSEAPAFLGRKTRAAPAAAPEPAAAVAEAPAPAAADGEEVKKPRRRRAPRSFEGGEGAPTSSEPEDA